MNERKVFAVLSFLVLLAVALLPRSRADEWDKRTPLTVQEPLAVPGTVLEPGKYIMKLADSPSDRHIVQIFNEDESNLATTVVAIPNYRLRPTGETPFSFWEMPAGQPHALRAWFYPGDNAGQEFAYPKDIATSLANANQESVPTAESAKGAITQTAPEGASAAAQPAPETMAQAAPPASDQSAPSPTPDAVPSNPAPDTPQTQPQSQSGTTRSLPRTASPYPLVGLAGLASLALAFTARGFSRRDW